MTTTQPTSAESAVTNPLTVPPFAVISGGQVQGVLEGRRRRWWSWSPRRMSCMVVGIR